MARSPVANESQDVTKITTSKSQSPPLSQLQVKQHKGNCFEDYCIDPKNRKDLNHNSPKKAILAKPHLRGIIIAPPLESYQTQQLKIEINIQDSTKIFFFPSFHPKHYKQAQFHGRL